MSREDSSLDPENRAVDDAPTEELKFFSLLLLVSTLLERCGTATRGDLLEAHLSRDDLVVDIRNPGRSMEVRGPGRSTGASRESGRV